ncbi:MAG: class I SAM-dependent methyltransferase family protein [Candidatus Geothermarchaeales archaeon]
MPPVSKLLEAVQRVVSEGEAREVVKGFDVVGDIAIVKIPERLGDKRFAIAEAFLSEMPSLRVVLNQESPVEGRYRLRRLEWLAGERRTVTTHREYGCLYRVDLAKVYFSPRLSHERMRIASFVGEGEIVVNMFSGVGPYSILIAKTCPGAKVYSIDINPDAVGLHKVNCRLNKVVGRVVVLEGDAREIIEEKLAGTADRVLMPLPEIALESLEAAIRALRDLGWIHVYLHTPYGRRESEALERSVEIVEDRLESIGVKVLKASPRRVREVGTRVLQVCVDMKIEKTSF